VDQLLDFSELVEGDFVVHLQHGIAQYRGLTKLETQDGVREVISLEFDDHVTLHVPLQESHLISRYVGLSKSRPQLGRIGFRPAADPRTGDGRVDPAGPVRLPLLPTIPRRGYDSGRNQGMTAPPFKEKRR